ncbi:Hypothetical predicted protein [Octopus vulgaris]|uniref:Uncharacterized protein n=1 Tax=Octopus vulgaris TaxID=6645 RepID=A0AA36FAN4_OCTVU|nr:Hypothetical predicted protein [Octopus vulgaris]
MASNSYYKPEIFFQSAKLNVVGKFIYLGSVLNRVCSLDDEIANRLQKVSQAFKNLEGFKVEITYLIQNKECYSKINCTIT